MTLCELADKLKECDFDDKSHKTDEVAAMLIVLKDKFGCKYIYQLDCDMIYPVQKGIKEQKKI